MAIPGCLRSLSFLTIALTSVVCQAIDNPDAPDYLGDFQAEASAYEQAINQDAQTTSDLMQAYRDYIGFLEEERAAAAAALTVELSGIQREKFLQSQSAWKAYQEAERAFISTVWTRDHFGSSSVMSRLGFYAKLVKSRIELLQTYRLQF